MTAAVLATAQGSEEPAAPRLPGEPTHVRVGTSGWQYKDWRGRFYPQRLAQVRWLDHYVSTFDTVEVNATFYRLPNVSAVQRWADALPPGFVMTVKASRYLTHIKRLREPQEPVARLLERVAPLRDRGLLGPVLVQLPPDLPVEVERLDATLREVPPDVRVAVEPRERSWFHAEVRAVLEQHGAALVWADREGRSLGPLWRTTTWTYLRLHHGRRGWGYDRRDLRRWASRVTDPDAPHGDASAPDAYVYFNNDPGGAAVVDALAFRDLVRSRA
ncbi:MAG TPA: DUF72 domain-containing protein [Mycobacteriales bacterium]|nr:DUF72 domain-containing protein [Mycobacteriales bacterium]